MGRALLPLVTSSIPYPYPQVLAGVIAESRARGPTGTHQGVTPKQHKQTTFLFETLCCLCPRGVGNRQDRRLISFLFLVVPGTLNLANSQGERLGSEPHPQTRSGLPGPPRGSGFARPEADKVSVPDAGFDDPTGHVPWTSCVDEV